MKEKVLFFVFLILLITTGFTDSSFNSFDLYLGGGLFYNNHDPESFDGKTAFYGDSETFLSPLWDPAAGFFAEAGFRLGSSGMSIDMYNGISYYRAAHQGEFMSQSFSGNYNEVLFSAAWSFFKMADFISPVIMTGLSWGWLNIDNGVILSDSSLRDSVFSGMGIHIGGGLIIDYKNIIACELLAVYRVMDYLSGTYSGFSGRLDSAIGNGWYLKLGLEIPVLSEEI
ncbi:MAG: hypothetical protein GXP33_15785 [Spirochaetes bacterium]|nr:hypothetical protein [Spirochaetota bacterium]